MARSRVRPRPTSTTASCGSMKVRLWETEDGFGNDGKDICAKEFSQLNAQTEVVLVRKKSVFGFMSARWLLPIRPRAWTRAPSSMTNSMQFISRN